jgi:hypothetical protein
MDRRILILVGLAVLAALAGCSDPEASIRLEETTAEAVAAQQSIEAEELHPQVHEAIENGSSTLPSLRLPDDLLEENSTVAYEGRYYSLDQERAGTFELTHVAVTAETVDGEADRRLEELPMADRRAVSEAAVTVESEREREHRAMAPYTPGARNRSVLLDREPLRVAIDERTVAVRVLNTTNETETGYTYTASQVAPNASVYGQRLIEEYAFTLREPPNGSADVLDTAIGDGYYGEETEAVVALRERFEREPSLEPDDFGGEWLVRYEGQLYYARVD